MAVVSTKCIDPGVLELFVSNTTGNHQWGKCISFDFNFCGLSEPGNPYQLMASCYSIGIFKLVGAKLDVVAHWKLLKGIQLAFCDNYNEHSLLWNLRNRSLTYNEPGTLHAWRPLWVTGKANNFLYYNLTTPPPPLRGHPLSTNYGSAGQFLGLSHETCLQCVYADIQ